eukprot:7627222-Pyramimonas_sp.AAC.3
MRANPPRMRVISPPHMRDMRANPSPLAANPPRMRANPSRMRCDWRFSVGVQLTLTCQGAIGAYVSGCDWRAGGGGVPRAGAAASVGGRHPLPADVARTSRVTQTLQQYSE